MKWLVLENIATMAAIVILIVFAQFYWSLFLLFNMNSTSTSKVITIAKEDLNGKKITL